MADAVIPLPKLDTTPPVTNIYFAMFLPSYFFKEKESPIIRRLFGVPLFIISNVSYLSTVISKIMKLKY
jgi:hypothetical protein